jgi:hypothetical protein
MLLIEKGINPKEFANKVNGYKFPWLRFGLVIAGGCLGLGITITLMILDIVPKGTEPFAIALIGFFGALGLVISHYLEKKG